MNDKLPDFMQPVESDDAPYSQCPNAIKFMDILEQKVPGMLDTMRETAEQAKAPVEAVVNALKEGVKKVMVDFPKHQKTFEPVLKEMDSRDFRMYCLCVFYGSM